MGPFLFMAGWARRNSDLNLIDLNKNFKLPKLFLLTLNIRPLISTDICLNRGLISAQLLDNPLISIALRKATHRFEKAAIEMTILPFQQHDELTPTTRKVV
jgi:hypothetical protein